MSLTVLSGAGVAASRPGAPVVVVTPGPRSLGVTWTAPPDNGSPITEYWVRVGLPGSYYAVRSVHVDATTTSHTFSGLAAQQSYWVWVAAINEFGWGPAGGSPKGGVVTLLAVPDAPPQPTALAGDAAALVSWVAPYDGGEPITSYVVTPYVGGVAQSSQPFPATARQGTVTGLSNGTTYTFTVAATGAGGTGPPSVPSLPVVVGSTKPGAPGPVIATPGPGTVALSWGAAADNGSPLLGYRIRIGLPGAWFPFQVVTVAPSVTTYTFTGLTPGQRYWVAVLAENANGFGPWGSPGPVQPTA